MGGPRNDTLAPTTTLVPQLALRYALPTLRPTLRRTFRRTPPKCDADVKHLDPSKSSAMASLYLRRTVCRSTATVCRSTAVSLQASHFLSVRKRATQFAEATTAFGASTAELCGAAVLTACSQPWLVHHAKSTIDASYRLFGRRATEAVLRHTAFAHFVAGESAEEIAPKLQALRDVGVGGILDYAAEASLDEDDAPPHGVNQPARVYPFQNEEVCEENKRIFSTPSTRCTDHGRALPPSR